MSIELNCDDCGEHLGWITDSGPRGMAMCNACHEAEEADEDE